MGAFSDDRGFLEAICREPSDRGLRLIYADWLEDHGQEERAEVIRLQIELTTAIPHPDHTILLYRTEPGPAAALTRGELLRRRERELLDNCWSFWLHEAYDSLSADCGVSKYPSDKTYLLQSNFWYHVHLYDKLRSELGEFICSFRQGFTESIYCRSTFWFNWGPKMVLLQPIREVHFIDLSPRIAGSYVYLDGVRVIESLDHVRRIAGLPAIEKTT